MYIYRKTYNLPLTANPQPSRLACSRTTPNIRLAAQLSSGVGCFHSHQTSFSPLHPLYSRSLLSHYILVWSSFTPTVKLLDVEAKSMIIFGIESSKTWSFSWDSDNHEKDCHFCVQSPPQFIHPYSFTL